MRPFGDYVLIRKETVVKDTTTDSGIIIPGEIEEERASEGTIEAVGPEVQGLAVGALGAKVVFNEHQFDRVGGGHTYALLIGKASSIYGYAD